MQVGSMFQSCLLSICLLCGANIAYAEADNLAKITINKDYLMAQAASDAVLHVQASFCRFDHADLESLIENDVNTVLNLAKQHLVDFDLQTIKEVTDLPTKQTIDLLKQTPRTGDNYDKNCADIKANVAAKKRQTKQIAP